MALLCETVCGECTLAEPVGNGPRVYCPEIKGFLDVADECHCEASLMKVCKEILRRKDAGKIESIYQYDPPETPEHLKDFKGI